MIKAKKVGWDKLGPHGEPVGFEEEGAASGKAVLGCEALNAPSELWVGTAPGV